MKELKKENSPGLAEQRELKNDISLFSLKQIFLNNINNKHYTEKAIIQDVIWSVEKGILSCFIVLAYDDNSTQGYGGFNLSKDNRAEKLICSICSLHNSNSICYGELVGKSVRTLLKQSLRTHNLEIYAIGHIEKDVWLCQSLMFKN